MNIAVMAVVTVMVGFAGALFGHYLAMRLVRRKQEEDLRFRRARLRESAHNVSALAAEEQDRPRARNSRAHLTRPRVRKK